MDIEVMRNDYNRDKSVVLKNKSRGITIKSGILVVYFSTDPSIYYTKKHTSHIEAVQCLRPPCKHVQFVQGSAKYVSPTCSNVPFSSRQEENSSLSPVMVVGSTSVGVDSSGVGKVRIKIITTIFTIVIFFHRNLR